MDFYLVLPSFGTKAILIGLTQISTGFYLVLPSFCDQFW